MAEFKDYMKAVSTLASNAAILAGFKDKGKLVTEYNKYLLEQQTAGATTSDPIEKWATPEKVKTLLPDMTDEQRAAAVKEATDYVNNNADVKKLKDDLIKEGKLAAEKAGGVFSDIWNFIKNNKVTNFLVNNKFTAGAAALGGFAGKALGLGKWGTILLSIGAAIAGAVLGDKENGFIGKLLGMTPKTIPAAKFIPAPGQTVPLSTLKGLEPLVQFPKDGKFEDQAVSNFNPDTNPTLKDKITSEFTVTKDGRNITYYGTIEKEEFKATYVRVSDAADVKEGGTAPMSNIETADGKPGATLKVKTVDGKQIIEFDTKSSNEMIDRANITIKSLADQKIAGKTSGPDKNAGYVPETFTTTVTKPEFAEGKATAAVTITVKDTSGKYVPQEGEEYTRTFQGSYDKNEDGGTLTLNKRMIRKDGNITPQDMEVVKIKLPLKADGTIDMATAEAKIKEVLQKSADKAPDPETRLTKVLPDDWNKKPVDLKVPMIPKDRDQTPTVQV